MFSLVSLVTMGANCCKCLCVKIVQLYSVMHFIVEKVLVPLLSYNILICCLFSLTLAIATGMGRTCSYVSACMSVHALEGKTA